MKIVTEKPFLFEAGGPWATFAAELPHLLPLRFGASLCPGEAAGTRVRNRLQTEFSEPIRYTLGALFCTPFLQGPFFRKVFGPPEKQKKGHLRISEAKVTKISDYVFLFGSFFYKREKY